MVSAIVCPAQIHLHCTSNIHMMGSCSKRTSLHPECFSIPGKDCERLKNSSSFKTGACVNIKQGRYEVISVT